MGSQVKTAARLGRGVVALGVVGFLGVAAGCLNRPVSTQPPTTKTNFTTNVRQAAIDKIDILFAVDNSASMGDKQLLLAQAVPDLLNRLITPNCVDDNGAPVGGTVKPDGTCDNGKAEFQPVHDMHIGIVSSSLGSRGGDVCDGPGSAPAPGAGHNDDQGHLLGRGSKPTGTGAGGLPTGISAQEEATPGLESSNFLGWLPDVKANTGKSDPAAIKDDATLKADFIEAIGGVHEFGCGIEAQLESWYRFLVQPDPYAQIVPDPADANRRRNLDGVDATILKQRADFLRPDSLVAIILLSDEDDSAPDPIALNHQAWWYNMQHFPGSNGGGAPRGTSACNDVTKVNTPDCTSCGFSGHEQDPNCTAVGDNGQAGYYPFASDTLNTRYFYTKQRYGVDPQFPIERYVNGLKNDKVPNRTGEVYDGPGGTYRFDPTRDGTCTNPLFAKDLPADPSQELCRLARGPRSPDLVFYAAITGVPWQLLTENPADPASKFLTSIPTDRWKQIIGNDPEVYDYTGIDPHMIQSQDPRPGIAAGPTAGDTTDPYHGREWQTGGKDLQYACTFQLPAPKDCTNPAFAGACDCDPTQQTHPPLCQGKMQVRGKAYPCIRELTVAKKLGDQGIVASLCARSLDLNDANYGYRPAVAAIVDRLKNALAAQCLPQQLSPGDNNTCNDVPCLILETLKDPGPQSDCDKFKAQGLSQPDPAVLAKFREQQKAQQGNLKDAGPGTIDLTTLPVCQVNQLVPAGSTCNGKNGVVVGDFQSGSSCVSSQQAGWCYATGKAAGACPQAILFTAAGNPQVGATVSLSCIESSSAGTAGTDGGK